MVSKPFPMFGGDPLWSLRPVWNASSKMSPSSFLSLMVFIVLQVKAFFCFLWLFNAISSSSHYYCSLGKNRWAGLIFYLDNYLLSLSYWFLNGDDLFIYQPTNGKRTCATSMHWLGNNSASPVQLCSPVSAERSILLPAHVVAPQVRSSESHRQG